MLVLSRKLDQAIKIGSNITIKVIEIKGNQIKLGIEAPDEISILREEIYDAVKVENQNSLATSKPDLDTLPKFLTKHRTESD